MRREQKGKPVAKSRPGFDRKMTKEEIARLPLRSIESPILVVNSREHVEAARKVLTGEPVLGFDTETRPAYRKGESYPPALLQLCGGRGACIFQVRRLSIPPFVLELLSDRNVVKAGIAPGRDVRELADEQHFEPAGFVDLGRESHVCKLHNHGLRGLAGVLLGFRISKSAQRSNWARTELKEKQIRYAATDAWIGRELYLTMQHQGLIG